jgi:hypothetical protein
MSKCLTLESLRDLSLDLCETAEPVCSFPRFGREGLLTAV